MRCSKTTHGGDDFGVPATVPTLSIFVGCCAHAASGHAAATPPDFQAECLGGFEIDHQFKSARTFNRKIGGPSASEDAIRIGRGAAGWLPPMVLSLSAMSC